MESAEREREPLLRQLLDGLGLSYAIRRTESDEPYAGLRCEIGRSEVHVTARLLGRALRFRAENLAGPAPEERDLPLANELNLMWRTGRLDAARGWSLTTWAYGADDAFPPAAVRFAFDALRDAAGRWVNFPKARFVELQPGVPAKDDEQHAQSMVALTADELDRWPREGSGPTRTIDRLAAALGAHANAFQRVADGRVLTARFIVAGERDFLVDLFDPDGSTVLLRGRHDRSIRVDASGEAWRALQVLNERLALGAAAIDEGTVWYRLALPAAWVSIDAGFVDWLVSRAHASMVAIEQARFPTPR